MKLYFDDHGFDGQLQRTVGKSDAGMANVGECLYIASQIAAGDRDRGLTTSPDVARHRWRLISAYGAVCSCLAVGRPFARCPA